MLTTDFLNPERLWWLLAVAVLAAGYVASALFRRRAAVRFTQVDLLDTVAPSRPGWRRHAVAAIQLCGLAVAIVATARPVTREVVRPETEGRIMVLFDVSLSMQATDVDPDRLRAAQEEARTFVGEVSDDVEVGLISFAGSVNVEVPPTRDRGAVERAIDGLELAESTAIGDALASGARGLTEAMDDGDGDGSDGDGDGGDEPSDDHSPGVMVLLTDGETTWGRTTEEGAQVAADANIPVFTIAFGTPEGVIEDPVSGQTLDVPIRPEPLEEVAETTGGSAFIAGTGTELADVYDQIDELLEDAIGEEIEVVAEQTWKWAAAAVLIIAAGTALSLWLLRGIL
jgi:Ca-activated chloride channel family protein